MDGLSKVRPGEPLRIPAKAYNAFVDAALDHQQRSMSTTGDALRDQKQSSFVLIKNESGAARAQFDVLGIDGPIITRANNPEAFRSRIALRGVTPTANHVGRFVILHDALPNGTVGRAYVTGACLARVRMQDEAHTAADIDDGQVGQLASGEGGAASLLWVEPVEERANPEIAWAVVRFGGAVGGTVTVSSPVIIALLTSVQRFSEANPDLPAYHWREAQVTADGTAVEKADGEGSKTIPSCDSIVVDAENAAYSALAAPVVGNLPVSAFDPENGTMTVTIAGTEDTAHTVSAYRIRAGTDFVVGGGWADYGNSGVLPPGQAPSFEFTGLPLYTDIYVTITTNTSDAGSNHNRYIIRFGMNGIEAPHLAVEIADLNDPSGALLTTPVTGDYGGEMADGVTDLAIAWSAAPGATHYYVTAGTVYGDPNSLPGTWNLADHDVGSTTTDTITDAPADGTPFWVTLWWRTAPSFDWSWNRWRITITPSPDRRAVNLEDINTLEEGGAIIPAPPVDETPLSNPILVEVLSTKDSVGNDRFVFVRSEGGSAVGATLAYAQIESSIGTSPPFVYTARAVAANGTGGFGAPAGIDFDLYNLAEIGAGSSGVHAVPDGSIVAYWRDGATGERFFDRSFYRGTF